MYEFMGYIIDLMNDDIMFGIAEKKYMTVREMLLQKKVKYDKIVKMEYFITEYFIKRRL